MLKLSRMLLSILVVLSGYICPLPSHAMMSEETVMSEYANPGALQTAIDNGQVNYNDLPPLIQKAVHDKTSTVSGLQLPDFFGFPLFIPMLFIILFLPIILTFKFIHGRDHDDDSEEVDDDYSTEKSITKVSMENVKTKEEHPMGDKTHDQ